MHSALSHRITVLVTNGCARLKKKVALEKPQNISQTPRPLSKPLNISMTNVVYDKRMVEKFHVIAKIMVQASWVRAKEGIFQESKMLLLYVSRQTRGPRMVKLARLLR